MLLSKYLMKCIIKDKRMMNEALMLKRPGQMAAVCLSSTKQRNH
jgi:hypothetical protein